MDESPKARLRSLRDKLAATAPRVRMRPNVSADLVRRIDQALKQIGDLYLLVVKQMTVDEALGEAVDDAIVSAHLLLHETERAPEPAMPSKPVLSGINRRQHERHDANVSVKLLRHSTQQNDTGGVSLSTETATRAARNVSVGGIFVTLAKTELPQVEVGSVVHLEVEVPGRAPLRARGIVMRRDATGLGLRWVEDTDRVRRGIAELLEAVRKGSHAAGLA